MKWWKIKKNIIIITLLTIGIILVAFIFLRQRDTSDIDNDISSHFFIALSSIDELITIRELFSANEEEYL